MKIEIQSIEIWIYILIMFLKSDLGWDLIIL